MKIRHSALALALVAGALAPIASAQTHAKANRPAPARRTLSLLAAEKAVVPRAVAKVRKINGQMVVVSEWIPYTAPAQNMDVPDQSIFDSYEGDPLATPAHVPTGFCTSGCTQLGNCPAATPDNRW